MSTAGESVPPPPPSSNTSAIEDDHAVESLVSQHSPVNGPNTKNLLTRFRYRYKIAAAAHNLTATQYSKVHTYLTFVVLCVNLAGTIVVNIMSGISNAASSSAIINSVFFAVSGGLTAANNLFNFSKVAQQHVQLRDEYNRIVDLIDIAVAADNDDGGYDFNKVLSEIQELNANLKRGAIQIPKFVQDRIIELKPWDASTQAELPSEIRAADLF